MIFAPAAPSFRQITRWNTFGSLWPAIMRHQSFGRAFVSIHRLARFGFTAAMKQRWAGGFIEGVEFGRLAWRRGSMSSASGRAFNAVRTVPWCARRSNTSRLQAPVTGAFPCFAMPHLATGWTMAAHPRWAYASIQRGVDIREQRAGHFIPGDHAR